MCVLSRGLILIEAIMNIEKLKVIAEGMGYEAYNIPRDDLVYYDVETELHPETIVYDPENNPAQLLGIIEKLLIDSHEIKLERIGEYIHLDDDSKEIYKQGKTLSEAVLQAAYEVMK